MKLWIIRGVVTSMILILLIPTGAGCGSGTAGMPDPSSEERAIYQRARAYLDAEVTRDLAAVYGFLAPSSIYCATHDYAAYLSEAEASPVRIVSYRILKIADIRTNEDKQAFPNVEMFSRVEVDVQFLYVDTGKAAEVNFDFTFIREGGRWYKG